VSAPGLSKVVIDQDRDRVMTLNIYCGFERAVIGSGSSGQFVVENLPEGVGL
jgi:hypothetical protein